MKVKCSKCGAEGELDDSKIPETGARVKCPRCKEDVLVIRKNPAPGASSFADAAAGGSEALSPAEPDAPPAEPRTYFGSDLPVDTSVRCSVCNKSFSRTEVISFGEKKVCAACKPAYMQMLAQGLAKPGEMVYAGFWIRLGAKLLDGIAVNLMNVLVALPLPTLTASSSTELSANPGRVFQIVGVSIFLQILLGCSYSTFFVGRFQATPGKMVCGLKVVTSDSGRVSYLRALGRHFSEILSSIILFIGYLMAGFDYEKRALHDRLCDTRVVRK